MSLITNVEIIMERKLVAEEITALSKLQQIHNIDDSDPLLIVLAFMARNQLAAEALPNLLQKSAMDAITLHQQTLREQSTLIAKDLIVTISQNIDSVHLDWKRIWIGHLAAFFFGMFVTIVIFFLFKS